MFYLKCMADSWSVYEDLHVCVLYSSSRKLMTNLFVFSMSRPSRFFFRAFVEFQRNALEFMSCV